MVSMRALECLVTIVDQGPLPTGGTAHVREVMLAVGWTADGMIVSSRRRLLAHLRTGDGDAAALEMERHLRSLLYMWRPARPGNQAIADEAVP
jgi:hypothetical protein